ncbi:MAG: LysE family transporter [Thermodesulfovibrionales bacterium]
MKVTVLLSLVFLLGFLVAIPAGPIQIEVIRRSVHGHLKPSLMVILGAFLVDMLYGVVAFFGIAPFLEHPTVQAIFWFSGSMILGVLGVLTIRHSRQGHDISRPSRLLTRKRWSLLSGVSLSVTNPVMILWWLSSLNIFRDIGLVPVFTPAIALAYLFAGSLGLASYLLLLSLILHRAKSFISSRRVRQINTTLGVFLLLLSGYFFVHAILVFIK